MRNTRVITKETLGLLILLLLASSGCVQTPSNTVPNENLPIQNETNTDTIHSHHLFQGYADAHGISLVETQDFFEKNYLLTNEKDIFEALPTLPRTFEGDVEALQSGNMERLLSVPYETYIQPEFYPTFATRGIDTWRRAPLAMETTLGISTTPAEQYATLQEGTNRFESVLFVGSAWGATHYQGIAIGYEVIPTADIHVQFSPSYVMAGPAFPIMDQNWMHKIALHGNVGTNVGEGTYHIRAFLISPTPDQLEEGFKDHPTQYVPANEGIQIGEGIGDFYLTIPPR